MVISAAIWVINLGFQLAGVVKIRAVWVPAARSCKITNVEGVIWLAIASAAELPQVVLLILNLNDTLNLLFWVPSTVAIIIAGTRTYRSLIHSASPPDIHFGEPDSPNPQKSRRLVSHTKDSSVVHIPPKRSEVTVHGTYHEEYPMSQTNHYGSYPAQATRARLG